jgi:adhesin transport system outer membrane protein
MNFTYKTVLLAATLGLLGLLAGCAAKGTGSYVVLLRDPDGNAGTVAVQSPQGEQVLTQVFKAAALDGKKEPFFVMQDQLKRDFGAALAALPPLPDLNQPRLRFLSASQLTPQSQEDLKTIAQNIGKLLGQRRSLDISIIGHADSVPAPPGTTNKAIAQGRADAVRQQLTTLLREAAFQNLPPMITASHGDREPIDKADPTNPINRRVEITIR